MRSRRDKGKTVLIAGGMLATAASAHALDASDILSYSTGPVTFRPSLSVSEQYSDNIFYSHRNKESDFSTVVQPSLRVWLGQPTGENHVDVRYSLVETVYVDHSRNDSVDHVVELSGTIQGARLSTDARDRFQVLSSIYGGPVSFEQGGIGVSGVYDRRITELDHMVTYTVGPRTETYLRGMFYWSDFLGSQPDLWDNSSVRGTAGFSYSALAKTAFYGEAHYGQMAGGPNHPGLRKGPHAEFIGGYVGAKGDFTPRISGRVQLGYQNATYADGTDAASSPVAEVALSWRFTEKASSSLTYTRRSGFSVRFSKQSAIWDLVNLQAKQGFGATGRLSATLGGYYGRSEYVSGDVKGLSQDFYGARVDLDYMFRTWLKGRLSYEFQTVASAAQFIGVDYALNRITFTLSVGY